MKVIDLLNKIANDEEVPNIKVRDRIYEFCDTNYVHNESGHIMFGFEFEDLNDEIEIIEEDKEIEEIKSHYVLGLDESLERVIEWQKENNKIYENKINEIIKAVNELKKGK